MPLLGMVDRAVGAAVSDDIGDQSPSVVVSPPCLQGNVHTEPHFGVSLEPREETFLGYVALESRVQCSCAPTMVFIFPKERFPGAETLPVTQYLQSLCSRLSFAHCCSHKGALSDAAGARGFGGSQDRGETLAPLAIWNLLSALC